MDPSDVNNIPAGSVVVGVDGSPQADAALTWAAVEARRRGLPLHLVHAQENYAVNRGLTDESEVRDVIDGESADEIVAAAAARAREAAPGVSLTGSSPWGGASQVLVAASDRAAFMVLGTRGRSRRTAAILGTVSLQTAAHARCPVVVIRSEAEPLPQAPHVVVGVDGSADSVHALRFAFESAAPNGTVTSVTTWWLEVVDGVVVTTPESEQWESVMAGYEARVRRAVGDLPTKFPDVTVNLDIRRAHPSEALLEASKAADLLVVGSRGRGGFAGLMLGSVSQHMLTGAACPVAVVTRRRA